MRNVVWKEKYRPYGERLDNPAAEANNKTGYAGKPFDTNTGLSYFGARYYDPVVGRFTGIDPAGPVAGNIHSLNRYTYANNNPYRFVDPDGRAAQAVAGGVLILGLGYAICESCRQSISNGLRAAIRGFQGVFHSEVSEEGAATAPPTVGSGPTEQGAGQKDVTKRPSRVRKGTEQSNWDNAEDGENGGEVCPTCGREVKSKAGEKNKDWDNDHVEPWRERDLTGKDRQGVLDEYNRDTRLHCVNCNRSDNGN